MNNGVKAGIIIGGAVLIMGAALMISSYAKRIPSNSISLVGNTSGNLANEGLFCEKDDVVYFSNTFDHGCIYSMTPDETNIRKVNTAGSKNIMVAGDYLYYFMDTSSGGSGLGYVMKTFGIYRSKTNGNDGVCLDREAAFKMQLVGDYIYYQRSGGSSPAAFFRIKTDKSGLEQVSDVLIDPVAALDGVIYFSGTEKDHYLYALDTRSNTIYTVYQGNLCYPQYSGGYIYFLDISSDYSLCRYSLSSKNVEILTNDRIDTYNVGNDYIYYQRNDAESPALIRMYTDGRNPEVIANGNFKDINMTDKYAYFRAYNDDMTLYHSPLSGTAGYEIFNAASQAVE